MEVPDSDEMARSFMEWTTEDVVKWLRTLLLFHDYSVNFREWGITGAKLVKLSPATLNEMNITEGADRVKILQHATTMRANLIPSSPTRRVHSPIKFRRFSENTRPSFTPTARQQQNYVPRTTNSLTTTTDQRTSSPLKYSYPTLHETSPVSAPLPASPSSHSGELSSDSPASSRISSPVKLREHNTPEARMHYFLQTDSDRNSPGFLPPPPNVGGYGAMRRNNINRRSRSLDGLFQDGEDIFTMVQRKESCSSRLVEILREENGSLKRELESYYQRVRKLQKLEQEVEHVREAQRLLEANTVRREKLERAMRSRLEQELLKLREDSLQRKAELNATKKQDEPIIVKENKNRRELKRRDTMIMRLIKQNKDATAVREQLEYELQTTQAALRDKGVGPGARGRGSAGGSNGSSHNRSASEIESKAALMYTESIEKLKAVLSAMQNMSKKREGLERRLHTALEGEITQLREARPVARRWGVPSNKESGLADKTTIAKLEADVAKWEQKCLELVAERQMAFEIATVPRDTRISQLQQRLAEMDGCIAELKQQKSVYVSQLADSHQRITELETRIASLQSSLGEKESIIQTLQTSFLEPDDDIDSSLLLLPPPPPLSPSKAVQNLHSFTTVSGSSNTLPLSSHGASSDSLFPVPSSASKNVGHHLLSNGARPVNGVVARTSIPPHAKLVTAPSGAKISTEGGGGGGGGNRGFHNSLKLTSAESNSSLVSSSPFHRNFRQFAPIHSHSEPNSPRVRVARKPRTSQPNLRLPSNHAVESSSSSSSHTPAKMSPNVISKSQFRAMKSKTPPPHYRVSSSQNGERKKASKPRHHSTDGFLDDQAPPSKNGLELFESLVGGEGGGAGSLGSSPVFTSRGEHRHSKSSPTPYDRRVQI